MDDEFKDLQRLLRLKRYEAPPPAYFEDFLFDFHRRQRAELLRRPLWRLVVDRFAGGLAWVPVSRYAYAGACATAVAATVLASNHILHSGPAGSAAPALSVVAAVPAGVSFHVPLPARLKASSPRVSIFASNASLHLSPDLDFDRPRPAMVSYASSRPRPVLDAQPVSYEQPYSF